MLHFFACKERKIIFDKGLFWDNIFYSRFLINNQLIRGVVKHLKNTQKRKTRERELQNNSSHPVTSSGGTPSLSVGYSSKLEVSKWFWIFGVMGTPRLRLRRPSQLKPSNHLNKTKHFIFFRIFRKMIKTYLCFVMSLIPPFWYPNRSAELSLHNFLINSLARPVILRGKSIASIPFKIML